MGAAVNAAIDRVWPSVATAAARAANERVRAAHAAEVLARAKAHHVFAEEDDDEDEDDADNGDMPSEFPERWSRFLPPDDVKSRLHSTREHREKEHRDNGRDKESRESRE